MPVRTALTWLSLSVRHSEIHFVPPMKYKSYPDPPRGSLLGEFVFRVYVRGGAVHACPLKRDKVGCGYERPREDPNVGDLRKHVRIGNGNLANREQGETETGDRGMYKEIERRRERAEIVSSTKRRIIRFFCLQENRQGWLQPRGLHTPHRRLFMHMQPAVTGRTTARCHLLHVPLAKTLRVSCSRTSPAITLMYVIIFPRVSAPLENTCGNIVRFT